MSDPAASVSERHFPADHCTLCPRSRFKGSVPAIVGNKAKANDALQRAGFDGITHTGGHILGSIDHTVWIAFEPNQIKSIGNSGDFDPANERMDYTRIRGMFNRAFVEKYKFKSATGQGSLWDEDLHPRADDGEFSLQWNSRNQGERTARYLRPK